MSRTTKDCVAPLQRTSVQQGVFVLGILVVVARTSMAADLAGDAALQPVDLQLANFDTMMQACPRCIGVLCANDA